MSNLIEESPIFILSFCWRTGSTLLQRSINSTGDALLWGEPHVISNICNSLRKLRELSHETAWARDQINENGWEGSWAPTIQPEDTYIDEASRSLFYKVYGQSANDLGVQRWGFKEVRPDAANNARFLKRIFPKCKIIFHYRDPIDVFKSVSKTDFFDEFVDEMQPMNIWSKNACEVIELLESGFDGFLISHEDFTTNKDVVENLFKYIEVEITEEVYRALSNKTGATSTGSMDSELIANINAVVNNGLYALKNFKK